MAFITIPALLIVFPALVGSLICLPIENRICESSVYRFVIGFITIVGIWGLMTVSYQYFFPYSTFHILCCLYIIVILILSLVRIVLALVSKEKIHNIVSCINSRYKSIISEKSSRIMICVFLLLTSIQLFNAACSASSEYVADDLYYYTNVNDTVYMDQIGVKTGYSGRFPLLETSRKPYHMIGYKQYLAPWYSFFALIAVSSNIHPLIICHTVMPVYILILIYLSGFIIASFLYKTSSKSICIFMMNYSLLIGTFCYSFYQFHLAIHIIAWGKIPSALVGIPVLLISINNFTNDLETKRNQRIYHCVQLFLSGCGVATMTASNMLIASTALFLFMTIAFIKSRKRHIILYALFAELPFLLQLILWRIVINKNL